jgi:flagellar basal-body rod protein FlgB
MKAPESMQHRLSGRCSQVLALEKKMAGKLDDALGFYQNALRLRTQRQQLLASNIANADTPNYKARDLDFAKNLQAQLHRTGGAETLTRTHPAHLSVGGRSQQPQTLLRAASQNSLDGNTVDLDVERAAFTENALHYEADLTLATDQIKGLLAALQG